MFQITITFGSVGTQWALLFREESLARAVWQKLSLDGTPQICIDDDFGQSVQIKRAIISGIMFEELEKSQLAHIEIGLHRARVQARAQQMAASDPVLRTAQQFGPRGPAVMTPFEGSRFNGR